MLISITSFGSVWRHRPSMEVQGSHRFAGPVYYNTTGVVVNGEVRQRPKIAGYARFDAIGGFDPNHPSRMINRVFECAEPSVWMGCNKLLFRRIVHSTRPDQYFIVIRSETFGHWAVSKGPWRSPESWLIAFSVCAEQQEAMLLLSSDGWIQTEIGRFIFKVSEERPWEGRLVLCSAN